MNRPVLRLPPRTPKRPKNRRQFIAWLEHELRARGESLPEQLCYARLRDATERQLKVGA